MKLQYDFSYLSDCEEKERWKIRTLINIAAILQLKILQFKSLSVYGKISFTMKYNFKKEEKNFL